jgi:hypothetical protein
MPIVQDPFARSRSAGALHLQASRQKMRFACNIDWPTEEVQFPVEIKQSSGWYGQRVLTHEPWRDARGANWRCFGRQGINRTARREAFLRPRMVGGRFPAISLELLRDGESSATAQRVAVADVDSQGVSSNEIGRLVAKRRKCV